MVRAGRGGKGAAISYTEEEASEGGSEVEEGTQVRGSSFILEGGG